MNAAIPLGHRPMCEPLIEIAREKSNERWMDPAVDIQAADGAKPVAVPDRCGGGRGRRQRPGAAHGEKARVPEPAHRSPFLARRIVLLAQRG